MSSTEEIYQVADELRAILLGIFDSRLWHSQTKVQLYHAVFLVEAGDSLPTPGPETTDAAFREDDLPPLSPGHHLRVPFVFRQIRGKAPAPFFDPVDDIDNCD